MGTARDILPPMPWDFYGLLSDDDLKAIWAYLGTIPPIQESRTRSDPAGGRATDVMGFVIDHLALDLGFGVASLARGQVASSSRGEPTMGPCDVCGSSEFEHTPVLWPSLISEWGLDADEAAYIDIQQGTRDIILTLPTDDDVAKVSIAERHLASRSATNSWT